MLLLHGYSSRKEHVAEGVGGSLMRHGIASLSIDLPLHGTRADPLQAQAARNPLAIVSVWRTALKECRLALGYLRARPEIDRDCTAVAGYSLGSFLAVMAAADDPAVRAVVLAAGGDLPAGTPLSAVARTVADPVRAVRKLNGRPLLMVHGTGDRTMRPEQAQRLFQTSRFFQRHAGKGSSALITEVEPTARRAGQRLPRRLEDDPFPARGSHRTVIMSDACCSRAKTRQTVSQHWDCACHRRKPAWSTLMRASTSSAAICTSD